MQFEKHLEEYVIENLKNKGWNYVNPLDLPRVNSSEVLLKKILAEKIKEINHSNDLTGEDINEVIRILEMKHNDQNGIEMILYYLKYGIEIKLEKSKTIKKIFLIDYDNIEKNDFIVTNQFQVVDKEKVRLDVVLFVNGIPLVNIELKNPYSYRKNWYDAYKDIKHYEETIPEFYKYAQIGIAFAEKVKYFPIVTWQKNVATDIWRGENLKEDEDIFEMLEPKNLVDIIRNFLFIKEVGGEMTKIICRYMQFRAANKIYQRVIDNLEGKTHKNKGLIWHWQGSGKTFTMIFACHKLYLKLGNPTIFFIVDRIDLEKQFSEEFLGKLKLIFKVEKIESIEHLKEILEWDNWNIKRGVFLTLLHKFNINEKDFEVRLKDQKITQRKDIICFFDEVHRTQYGNLKLKLKNILKNTFHFGFTGTPITKIERNTFEEFSYPNEKEFYLDRYFLDEAERDGYIVPIVYQPRLEDVHLKSENIEWFIENIDFEEIGEEIAKENFNEEIKNKLNEISIFLENEKRIEMITKDIAEHFKENFDTKFKALIVTANRLCCVIYKRYLDKVLPPEYSEIVMTFRGDKEEKEEILEYKNELRKRFNNNDEKDIIKEIIDKFRYNEYPKILIVTDMLITGFDEPKLGVMYLDKLLKDHRLLQTVARVNRPFKDIKSAGVIIDYVGIFKFLNKALKFYSQDEIKGSGGIINKKQLFKKFKKLIEEMKKIFEGEKIKICDFTRENIHKATELLLQDEDISKKFKELYKECRKIFEILGSFEKKMEYLVEYKWFTCVYEYYLKLILEPVREEDKKFFERTKKIIKGLIEFEDLEKITPPLLIDFDYIKKLKDKILDDQTRAIAILNGLDRLVRTAGVRNPIYKLIQKRVEELIKKWRERKISYEELIKEENIILEEIEEANLEKENLKFDDAKYGVFYILRDKLSNLEKNEIINIVKRIFELIDDLIATKDWQNNNDLRQKVEKNLRKLFADLRLQYKWSYDDFDNLYKEIKGIIYENT